MNVFTVSFEQFMSLLNKSINLFQKIIIINHNNNLCLFVHGITTFM